MDGLSVATGVAGLLSVCIQASQALSEYYTGVANAPKSIQSLQQEFTTLEHVMKQLENFLRSQTLQDNSFNKTSALCSAVGACKDQVSDILAKLKRPERGSISRAVKRLEWPFQEKDVLGMVEKLRRYIQTFHFSLTVEGWSVTPLPYDCSPQAEVFRSVLSCLRRPKTLRQLSNSMWIPQERCMR